ncbi:MAG: hypothetical protein KF878_10270 [Planctomycetes bacterium]|nr:hypothetical protein [Planctomycetota bacterium]
MATFLERLTFHIDQSDLAALKDIAGRMRAPTALAARLLLAVGIQAARRDPSLLLGGAVDVIGGADPTPDPAPAVPGLPHGARTRARGGAA